MSDFLGSQNCIESLRKDLIDLQGATIDVFSRTGPVCFSSWKFPDKLSWSLDMVALLEQYDFVDGEDEFNKHSHVVLLELVIDRLLLLLQSFDSFVEQISSNEEREPEQQRGCLSVGLIVRKYWRHLVHFNNLRQTAPRNPGLSSRSCAELPSQSRAPSLVTRDPPIPQGGRTSVGCQTSGASLRPCDACHQTRSALRRAGDAWVGLFQSQGWPSSPQPLPAAEEESVEPGPTAAAHVTRWADQRLRDVQRLAEPLQEAERALRGSLEEAGAEVERLRARLTQARSHFKQELDRQQADVVQLEFSLSEAQRCVKEAEARREEEQQHHRRETQTLEGSNSRLEEKVAAQEDALRTLHQETEALREKAEKFHLEEEARCKLEQTVERSEARLSHTQLLLDKEKAKYQSAWRQQESMLAKHQCLLKRVDALYEECEELQGLLGESQDRQADLLDRLKLATEEKERAQAGLRQQQGLCLELQEEKQALRADVGRLNSSMADLKEYVQTLRERESLNPLPTMPQRSPGPASAQLTGTEQNHPTQTSLQSSSGTLLGDSRRGTGRRWSDQASEELPSTANAAPPSCQKPQTVDIHLNSTSSRSHLKPRNASVSRRKLNTPVHTFK